MAQDYQDPGFVDPNDPRYRDFPTKDGQGNLQPAGADYDIDAWYQRTLGRAPDANERSTDLANIGKYGAGAFESDFLSKRPSNQPGTYAPQQATAQYSGTSQAGAGDANLGQFMSMLQSRDAQQQQQRAKLGEILMGQLGSAMQPVSANSPGIREVLAGGRLGLQRGAERERRNAAELRAYDGSGGLGGKAFDSDVQGILQRQGEAEARMTGDVLGQQLDRQEQKIQRLLTIALQLGDNESARNLAGQLDAIRAQLGQSNFYDTMGFNYAGLNQSANQAALMALLNAA